MKPDAVYHTVSKNGAPRSFYIAADSTSKGMTHRLCIEGANANLEKRLEIS